MVELSLNNGETRADAHPSRDCLAERYREVRALTLSLTKPLGPEDCMVQSMPEASPTKWHLGHTTWFFETFVARAALSAYRDVDQAYASLFNSYYLTVNEPHSRADRGLLSRPTLEEVLAYRHHVDEWIARAILEMPGKQFTELGRVIETGIHHEQQHQELLLTDIKHAFGSNPLEPRYRAGSADAVVGNGSPGRGGVEWVAFEGGRIEVGHGGSGFAFDNERPRHTAYIDPFEIQATLVTCGQFLRFIEDGGYEQVDLWLSDGWDARCRLGWTAPLYWRREGAGWSLFTLHGRRPLDPEEPVTHLSYYEADAYARWRGARLPREIEWEHAAASRPVEGRFLDQARLHPLPAGDEPAPAQLFGDVWEWTASAYLPYPGYRPPTGPLGEYNGKFMCNQMVLRGGSCVTPPGHMRGTYRNYLPPEARWQFSGLRLAR